MGSRRFYLLGYAFLSGLSCANAFYLPGAAPKDFFEGKQVKLFVNALTPMLAGNDNAKLVCTGIMSLRLRFTHNSRHSNGT